MWSSLVSMTNAVTGAFYTAEQPPFDCAWPPKPVDDASNFAEIAAAHKKQMNDLQTNPEWQLVEYHDPDGGDMHLFSRPQFGYYHCLKATFSLTGVSAQQFIALVGSSDIKARQSFSADCVGLECLAKPSPNVELVQVSYWAPPPVAGRDFCFVVGHSENADGSFDLHGCSVDSEKCPEKGGMTVRGASLWGWHLTPVGNDLLISYVNCFDPRGWTPGFLLSWLKTTAAKEFCAIRARLLGKDVTLKQTALSEAGFSQEEIAKEVEARKQQEAAAAQ